MKTRIYNSVTAVALALTLGCASFSASAESPRDPHSGDRGADMAVDALLVRPIGLIGSIVGAAVWIVSLPFTLPAGNPGEAAEELVGKPLAYTFKRPLGHFRSCDNYTDGGC